MSAPCDTIPPARLAANNIPIKESNNDDTFISKSPSPTPKEEQEAATPRKLCVRHQRMADEGINFKLQQSLDALPLEERESVNAVWSNFSSSSHPRRALILQGLLTMCCFSQLSLLTEQLAHLIRIDPFVVLPREIALKILGYLDATSLCRASQVTKRWKRLADDNTLWRGICEQHIGTKCHKCGWGLPVLENKRVRPRICKSPSPGPASALSPPTQPSISEHSHSLKRAVDDASDSRPAKRQRSECPNDPSISIDTSSSSSSSSSSTTLLTPDNGLSGAERPSSQAVVQQAQAPSVTRPWKDVYSERMTVERNWRRGRCSVRTFKGHTDGVMCLQFSETLSHPSFPVLITGSYDRTVRVWNLETGAELHCLKGHTRAVRALQFDEVKLITGSMDCTIKVWDWRRGQCIRTLNGHTEGVVCLNFDDNVLASGSVDSTIKVWNLRTGGAFTLRGHGDWVNAVQLWDSNPEAARRAAAAEGNRGSSIFDVSGGGGSSPMHGQQQGQEIDPGKMLFSASDDGTIKLWDLNLRTCVRVFTGHVGQVQSMRLLLPNECDDGEGGGKVEDGEEEGGDGERKRTAEKDAKPKMPVLISGSLDNTIKLWDIETGKAVRTYFGHIEGVWGVASDKLRLVSASHDRTIKVWSREQGNCTATLVGHQAAVSCLALGEDKIVSGSDDCNVKVWSFNPGPSS
ncbi:hypothetical protein CVT24_003249 [Panaeolus cyanescens]|uniref:F-box domain-containing protein n=1 Tax=Panaeolus cyanescens TaxID=181874 RepID=A0A409W1V5_9AGAR|nr:hypothetical protein CVT24_003249 [Panaeolus cyanescens]